MDGEIETYAPLAIDRWTAQLGLRPDPRGNKGPHDSMTCPCLVCSDGREVLGLRPLIPSWSRRAVPDVYRGRFRR